MKTLMSGNEAIARGAYECGVRFASGYPGTPSTEILEEFSTYDGVYAEWSPNEKVALEVGIGAAMAGAKSLVTMKHVGVNVAADPLFTVSYTGTNGALVLISADDPSLHSSQNEQDNRNYAKSCKIPMLEPADSAEAKQFIKMAFELSARFDTPVMLRTTTRVAHSKGVVSQDTPVPVTDDTKITINTPKYVMVPGHARQRRLVVEKRLTDLKAFAEAFAENRMEMGDPNIGIIVAGMPYNYAKEVFPGASFLKLGMIHPLPEGMIRSFAAKVKKLYVVEELDPFLEEQIRAMGIEVIGKAVFPFNNEFDPGIIEKAIRGTETTGMEPVSGLPPRPPNLCPGCPHRGLFHVLGREKVFVAGDIGCYTLSFLKPLEGLHSCICMGASIGMAHGMSKALGEKGKGKIIGVLGDSTFLHSGITPLLNMVYNRGEALVVIADNRTTAMTGMQEHPATGFTLQKEKTKPVDLEQLVRSLGVENVQVVDPYHIDETRRAVREELARPGVSVIISRRSCMLFKREAPERKTPFRVDVSKCIGCKACIGIGCPPISWRRFADLPPEEAIKNAKHQEGNACIDADLCTGCTVCRQICKAGAIVEVEK